MDLWNLSGTVESVMSSLIPWARRLEERTGSNIAQILKSARSQHVLGETKG